MPFPVEEKYIAATEEKLGVKFPTAFKYKMKEENGGEIEKADDVWYLFPFFDTSDKKRLKRTSNDIAREAESSKSWPGFPESGIAIGHNGCGDKILFLPEGNSVDLSNPVYFFNHETSEISKIADDFFEFYSTKA